jgi:hypothetical protein
MITNRVYLIVHNPVIRTAGGRSLSKVMGWNDPDRLVREFIADVQTCSHGAASFEIVDRMDVDAFPVKQDGFCYTEETFLASWKARRGFHDPDLVDYSRLVSQFAMLERVRAGEIDEVWLFAFPYAGYYESHMAGPGAFWCNSPPLSGTERSNRRFVIMGFNFERGVGEMLESFGHRAESLVGAAYAHTRGDANLWERFTRYERSHPGRAEVGTVHFAPNSERDYDWGNRRVVPSRADTWYNFPDLSGKARAVNCEEWGGGDIRSHHKWWFSHFPHFAGDSHGISHNWWQVVMSPELVGG